MKNRVKIAKVFFFCNKSARLGYQIVNQQKNMAITRLKTSLHTAQHSNRDKSYDASYSAISATRSYHHSGKLIGIVQTWNFIKTNMIKSGLISLNEKVLRNVNFYYCVCHTNVNLFTFFINDCLNYSRLSRLSLKCF